MILIVTLNPLLERRFHFNNINYGGVNRSNSTFITAGGKGINISRQLKLFNINSFNFIFTGGLNGKIYKEILRSEGLEFTQIETKVETRHAAIVFSESEQKATSVFSENPEISESEIDEFKLKLEKIIRNCEIVVFAGSSPSEKANSIIPFGIELANKFDKISICDAYGNFLKNCFEASPTVVHNNLTEIKDSLGVSTGSEKDILQILEYFYSLRIKRAYLTHGGNSFYSSNFDFVYRTEPLNVNAVDSTGCGDCFVAALIYGWINNLLFEDSLKLAVAAASLNSTSFNVCKVDPAEAEKLKENVKVAPVGKKIKLIDDSPHII